MTEYLTLRRRRFLGIPFLATAWLFMSPAFAQEPVIEPVIEDQPPQVEQEETQVEPVIEPEQAAQSSSSEDEPTTTRSAPVVDAPSRVARVGFMEGEVTVAPAGTDEWADAALNRPLTSGDRVWVENGGKAELQIGSAAVYLDGNTGFGLIELDDDVLQGSLTEGAATIRVRRLAEGETIQIETPHSTVMLDRVGEYHLEVDKAGDRTIVKTRNGEAVVKGAGKQSYTVRSNERGVFSGMDKLDGRIESLGSRTAFENWANDRDARNERSESAKYVSRDVIGYEDLDDNGEWISEPEYGHVWRPTYVAAGWAPYRYGRWVYVSPWGWSWIDDARWGFAPSHYGRWAYLRNNWCWVPGPRHIRPVYAPALVGWVGGPSASVSVGFGSGVGWYPLGPRDVFYPGYRYTPRYIRHVNVSNTIIINNNYFYGGRYRHPPSWDYRRYPHAVTVVNRDNFVGGRPVGNHMVRLNDGDYRHWRGESRPPAIAPYRESVLGGQARRAPRDADRFREWNHGTNSFAGRVPFHAERSAIEANGGRPVGRTQLRDARNPKDGSSDFRGFRPTDRANTPGNAPRMLDNNSVRDWQARRGDSNRDRNNDRNDRRDDENRYNFAPRLDRERNASFTPRTQDNDRSNNNERERLEIMRADESRRRDDSRRDNHMYRPPSNSFQQGGSSNNGYRPRPESRPENRDSGRNASPVYRSEPRNSAPAPKEFRSAPPPQPRSQPAPRSNDRPARSDGGSRGGGGKPVYGTRER